MRSLRTYMVSQAFWPQAFRFLLLSVLSAAMTLGIPILLHESLHVEEKKAVAVALACAFVVNFAVLRGFVFKSTGKGARELVGFGLSSLFFRSCDYIFFVLLHEYIGLMYVTALLIVLPTSMLIKFCTLRLVVFAGKPQKL